MKNFCLGIIVILEFGELGTGWSKGSDLCSEWTTGWVQEIPAVSSATHLSYAVWIHFTSRGIRGQQSGGLCHAQNRGKLHFVLKIHAVFINASDGFENLEQICLVIIY